MLAPQPLIFADRPSAGRQLAQAVRKIHPQPPVSVLGLPRGGVPVAFEVARALDAPLDVLVVRKIGSPSQPEFALGAIASPDVVVRDPELPGWQSDARAFERVAQRERLELERRESLYRPGAMALDLHGRTAIVVDDGLATGWTMLAAVRAARRAGAAAVIAAAPVASTEAATRIGREADHAVFLSIPRGLGSVGDWYEDFAQVEDAEVLRLLRETRGADAGP